MCRYIVEIDSSLSLVLHVDFIELFIENRVEVLAFIERFSVNDAAKDDVVVLCVLQLLVEHV